MPRCNRGVRYSAGCTPKCSPNALQELCPRFQRLIPLSSFLMSPSLPAAALANGGEAAIDMKIVAESFSDDVSRNVDLYISIVDASRLLLRS